MGKKPMQSPDVEALAGIPDWILTGTTAAATWIGTLALIQGRSSLGLAAEIPLLALAVAPWWFKSRVASRSPAATAAIFVPAAVLALTDGSPLCIGLLALGTARLAAFGGRGETIAFALASAGVAVGRALVIDGTDWFIWSTNVEVGLALGCALRGFRRLVLSERAATLARARSAVADERRRIARDVHDAIAHSLSVMMLQLNGARLLIASENSAAEQALDEAISEGRRSLDEVRRVVGLLGPAPNGDDLTPTIAAAAVQDLVASYRQAGLDVDLTLDVEMHDLHALAGLPEVWSSGYRIIQESLANAVKHAPGAPVALRITATDDALRVRVENPLRSSERALLGASGHGVRGMRERVAQLGGELTCGVAADRWLVRCSLPFRPSPAERVPVVLPTGSPN